MDKVLLVMRMLFGLLYFFFVPGFILSLALFPKGRLDAIERGALSFGLSLALSPLLIFAGALLFAITINLRNAFWATLLLILVASSLALWRRGYKNRR